MRVAEYATDIKFYSGSRNVVVLRASSQK